MSKEKNASLQSKFFIYKESPVKKEFMSFLVRIISFRSVCVHIKGNFLHLGLVKYVKNI